MQLRAYQQRAIDALYAWWMAHPGVEEAGILVMPTGAGKSIVIAELTRLLFDTWPEDHPRTLVIVPSKELAEQNAEKLATLLPSHLTLGYYSASVGQRCPHADVIVATIGTVYRNAHLLGNIKCVMIDECHLVNPDGAGMYRRLVRELAEVCQFRVVGLTATPFRGNGIWLTDGEEPLFSGIAHTVTCRELLDEGFLAPLVRPVDVLRTRVDTSGISTAAGDYNVAELTERVSGYLPAAAAEACQLAADRRKWLAFLPTVENAGAFVQLLRAHGIAAALVCGETPKREREQLIAQFRAGDIRCLVTVLALATGFDVPDVDCIAWLRPTISPVLYVQGAGRGLRPAPGKTDCLWLDFSDTTQRLGPVDEIRGRKRPRKVAREAPFAICDGCGAQVRPASALTCPECGATLREPEELQEREASNAPVMGQQRAPKIVRYEITNVTYAVHEKEGGRDSLRVEYWSGMRLAVREWVCLEHGGFARAKARAWWALRGGAPAIDTIAAAYSGREQLRKPVAVMVNESGKFPEIVKFEWETADADARTA